MSMALYLIIIKYLSKYTIQLKSIAQEMCNTFKSIGNTLRKMQYSIANI